MSLLKTRCTDGRIIEFDASSPIGQGGEKIVFFLRDRKEVVCFFFADLTDRQERRRRLEKIIHEYNPTIGKHGEYWKQHFCWPTHLIDGDTSLPSSFLQKHRIISPPLGVVTPAYRETFFFKNKSGTIVEGNGKWFTSEKCRNLVPTEYQGNFLNYLQVCTKIARAVRRLHFAGLAHSDLSNKNVLISPKHGDACIIDVDSLVVPKLAPPSVIGTPGYIAPEVLARKEIEPGYIAEPCIETDLHALAVLIYENLLTRHPLRGPKVNSTHSAEEDEKLSLGARALFIEHSSDHSNALKPAPKVPLCRLGPHLESLFRAAFEQGLHDRRKRPSASDWERALYRTFDNIHPSPNGQNWFVLAPGMSTRCPFTGDKIKSPVPYARLLSEGAPGRFAFENRYLTIYHNMYLHDWHIRAKVLPGENADRSPKGYFSFYQNKWYLVNLSGEAMYRIEGSDTTGYSVIRSGESVELKKGTQLLMPGDSHRRLFIIDFIEP
jgi:hypothetical protein